MTNDHVRADLWVSGDDDMSAPLCDDMNDARVGIERTDQDEVAINIFVGDDSEALFSAYVTRHHARLLGAMLDVEALRDGVSAASSVERRAPVPDCICSPTPGAYPSDDCPRCGGQEPRQHPAARY
jgi:hypothetical protein